MSWLGPAYTDMGWIQVEGELPKQSSVADLAWDKAKKLLIESDWAALPDVPMTVGKKREWYEYRQKLRDIRSSVGFPDTITWPKIPE